MTMNSVLAMFKLNLLATDQAKVPCGCPSLQSLPPAKKIQVHPTPYGMTMLVSCQCCRKRKEDADTAQLDTVSGLATSAKFICALYVEKKPKNYIASYHLK